MALFLVILVMGIIDIGRAIFTDISIQEAAQEGAFYGAFEPGVTVAQIEQRAVDSTSSPALTTADVAVSCVEETRPKKSGSRVTVTVTHELQLLTPIIGPWFGGAMDLEKTAEAERFFEDCPPSVA